jgi:hypothetical protein
MGASDKPTGLSSPTGPEEVSALTGFDPSRFEYRFSVRDGHERHDWIASGGHGAINIWAEPHSTRSYGERWFGGIECHSPKPLYESDNDKPHHELCWLLLKPCWHDGSSLQFSEQVEERLPEPRGMPISGHILEQLRPLLRSRYRTWLSEPASAIEAGTAETGTGFVHESADPKGDAQ